MSIADTRVSFADHVRVFEPERKFSLYQQTMAKTMELFFQGSLSRAMCTGEFAFPLRNLGGESRGTYCDFWGVNYYTRTTVTGFQDGVKHGAPVNDLGWEIYPQGIVTCSRKLYEICPLPIYITENGTCDNDDAFRCRYICEHLKALCESGLPVQRYYHWCFTDNFEWAEGESARFGLVKVDYDTQERTVKKSGYFFRDVIAAGGVDERIYKEYVQDQRYHTNG
jgi:beta-glucosidase